MARRSVLQEIPIPLPQTEQQLYDVISEEEEDTPPYNKPAPAEHLHTRYISTDESKENITPTRLEDLYKEQKSQLTVLSNVSLCELLDDEPGPSSSSQRSDDGAANIATPRRTTEGAPGEPHTPMDFSTVTVGDLGISIESFTPKCSGKSPKTLHKYRRRSTIGVRGSPEMNFLIRQIALQRSNRKSEPEPPENPFPSPRNSILREKISAFRNAFQAVEEVEGKLSFPGFSEVEALKGEGEVRAEPPEKKKKVCDSSDAGITGTSHKPPATLRPTQASESSQKSLPEKTLGSDCSLASRLSTEVSRKPVLAQSAESQDLPSSSRCRKRKVMFVNLLSPPDPELSPPLISEDSPGPILKPALKKSPMSHFVHFCVGFREENGAVFSSQDSTDNDIPNKAEDSVKKKKRVTFGRELSPELFDKSLPANTPLRRGSTPYSHHKLDATPSAETLPCQSPRDPMPQPDFDVRDGEETLQPLSLCFDAESSDGDSPPSSPLSEPKESVPKEGEKAADHTESPSDDPDVPVSTENAGDETTDLVNESFLIPPEVSLAETRRTRSSNKLTSTEEKPESNGPKTKVRSTAKKNRKPVIVRKAKVKASLGKGQKKGGKSKKSAHSEREVVSKKPLLSPIPELPECGPTPPASRSRGLPRGKALLKKVRATTRTGKVHLTLEVPLEKNVNEKDSESPTVCAVEDVLTQDASVDPPPEDEEISDNGSSEIGGDLPLSDALDLAMLATPVSGECPPSTTGMEVTDDLSKQSTSVLSPGPKEKLSKPKYTKRRSSTRRYASHTPVTSEMTVEHINQDEDANRTSCKPETSADDLVQGTGAPPSMSSELPVDITNTSSSKLHVTTYHKSRRSSRNHQVSNILSATALGETGPAVLPQSANPPHFSVSDSCLPIDEVLQFPQQEKKVRRSMRLRRDSGVIGLSWVQEGGGSDTTGRESNDCLLTNSTLPLESAGDSPNKENISSYHAPNITRKARRRTLGTTTIQESALTSHTKRRRSNCFHKAPSIPSEGDEVVCSVLVPDVL